MAIRCASLVLNVPHPVISVIPQKIKVKIRYLLFIGLYGPNVNKTYSGNKLNHCPPSPAVGA